MVFGETNKFGKKAKELSRIQRYGKMDNIIDRGKEGGNGELRLGFLFGQPVISQELGPMPKDRATSVMPG